MSAKSLKRFVPGEVWSFLGSCKYRMFDVWPYLREQKAMQKKRAELKEKLQQLPAVSPTRENGIEVHMLCGNRDVDMGIWASWSLMRYIGEKATLVVHSDGSLTDLDVEMWRKVVPQIEVIPRKAADKMALEILSLRAPNVIKWRSRYTTSPQLIDAHLFGSSRSIIVMDSDVIVFQNPVELMELASSEGRYFSWCADGRNSYSADPDILQEITGIELPDRFNCGFLLAPRLSIDDYVELDRMLGLLAKDGRVDVNRFWACQTYYAMIAAGRGGLKVLPPTYTTCFGRTPRNCIARHYVGIPSVRYRMFKEGIPALLRQLS